MTGRAEMRNMDPLKDWQRLEYEGLPVYVRPEKPDWFVPNQPADQILRALSAGRDERGGRDGGEGLERARILSQIASMDASPYQGREKLLELKALKECWFHLTDACNLACRHCLFAASPASGGSLGIDRVRLGIDQAKNLGCTLFYFTGGEPFVYPGFTGLVSELLEDGKAHAVVLTNGLLLRENRQWLAGLPADRFHLQVSLDGLRERHEAIRGKGTFTGLMENLDTVAGLSGQATLSVAVNSENAPDLSSIVTLAADMGVTNIHLLWHFVRGKGSDGQYLDPERIWEHLEPALDVAAGCGVIIDNVETMKSQVFSTPATRYDLSNSGWESLTVGPDGWLYPSPALVGIKELRCGTLEEGLGDVWRLSPVLRTLRAATLKDSAYEANPLKFIIGGGDVDHSYVAGRDFVGHDPYVPLYNKIALWTIKQQVKRYPSGDDAALLLRMGDVRFDCPDGGREVSLTHCNCVISLADDLGRGPVREFYARAATRANEEIANPFAPEQALAGFIPLVAKKRSYGCGSPVHDARVQRGETLVDLGSGSGVECFLAARMVGPGGRVVGIDMTDEMLALADSSKKKVVSELGFDNVRFEKGYLEAIPLEDGFADVVISNCVINLSPDKRQTLHEAARVLRPGGRLVVSDIVTDEPVPVTIKNNERFRGECLGGALQQEELVAMLRAAGFSAVTLLKRFPYRRIGDTDFFSLTFAAHKPALPEEVEVIYRGPFAAVYTDSGTLLLKGKRTRLSLAEARALDDSVFMVDEAGTVTNMELSGGCCGLPPEDTGREPASSCRLPAEGASDQNDRHHSDCLVCGCELHYFTSEKDLICYYCGEQKRANAFCSNNHFVCDSCHQDKGVALVKKICTEAAIEDMVTLMNRIREQPPFAMHGPEHHAMVPGIILSTYRARGGEVKKVDILTAIERGSKVPGGVCGFWGSCGAAVGVGIAFSVILEATPLKPGPRQSVQAITARVLEKIASLKAGRCCQRESLIALEEAARLSAEVLPLPLLAESTLHCRQYHFNRECIRKSCPCWESRDQSVAAGTPMALVI